MLAAGGLVSGCSGENGESAVALRGRATAGGGGSARVSDRDERGCLGCVEAKKPLLEGGDEGNDRGREANLFWVCGGR
jgi:hypothetical protein